MAFELADRSKAICVPGHITCNGGDSLGVQSNFPDESIVIRDVEYAIVDGQTLRIIEEGVVSDAVRKSFLALICRMENQKLFR